MSFLKAGPWFWLVLALVWLNPISACALDPSKYLLPYTHTAWKNQKITNFPNVPGVITSILEGRNGNIWLGRLRPVDGGPLCQIASLCNEERTVLNFAIPPAWYQTKWFLMLWVVTGIVAVWTLYRLQMHKVAQSPNAPRTATAQENELAQAFRRAIEDCKQESSIEASLSVIGDAKEMHPVVRDEVCWIGCEAIRNACRHSRGGRLEVVLTYSRDLTLRVADDGMGINRAIVDEGKERHFGLQSMLGRAARIGAKLNVASAANAGTEITVLIPGSIVFRKT